MPISQHILRRTRAAIVALACLAALSALATPAAAAVPASDPHANTLSAAGSTQKSLSTDAAWTKTPILLSTVATGAVDRNGPIRIQVLCTVSLSPPFLMGNGNVGVDWSVTCDGQVRMIQGIVGILNSSGAALGNTVDQFTIFGLGGGNLIQRPCASGTLNGAMRVRVTFLSGTPLVIEGLFFGPPVAISC
jgi:hypothetical protein